MSGTLPTVRGGVQALCPVTRRISFSTDVQVFANSTEQRAKLRPPLTDFVLPYTRMSVTDTGAMRAFFESQKGQYDTTWSFTLGATTYSALTLTDKQLTYQESASNPGTYSFTLNARQTKNPGATSGSLGTAFPANLTGGVRSGQTYSAQLPYSQSRRFDVLLNEGQVGQRYSYTCFAGGLTGYPTRSLRAWEMSYPALTDADLAILETHFRNNWGQFGQFTFTDPDDLTAYTKCRYASDVLEITHHGPYSSLTLRIMETN